MAEPVYVADTVGAPSVSPSGLYAVSTPVDVDRPVTYGVDVRTEALGGHGLWGAPVCAPGDRRKTGGEAEMTTRFPGTAVWAAEACAAVGIPEQESEAAARRRLLAVESSEAEVFTASSLADRAVPATVPLAEAESMFRAEGVIPVLHVRPSDVTALIRSKDLIVVGAVVRTLQGSPVAVGAGYQNAFPADTAYLTGPVTIYRNSVDVYTAFNSETNERLSIAERAIAPTWTGQTLSVSLTGSEG